MHRGDEPGHALHRFCKRQIAVVKKTLQDQFIVRLPDRPDVPPTGIRAVLISGQVMAQDGQIVSRERRGRVLRG